MSMNQRSKAKPKIYIERWLLTPPSLVNINSKQIENAKSKYQMNAPISNETYPDLCCVVGNVNALQELQELMKSEDKHNGQTILSYDITRLLSKNRKS